MPADEEVDAVKSNLLAIQSKKAAKGLTAPVQKPKASLKKAGKQLVKR